MPGYELKHAGDTALVVEFGETVDRDVSSRVVALAETLKTLDAPGVVELIPTFRSLMVRYEPMDISADEVNGLIARALALGATANRPRRRWVVPVCFEGAHGLDADYVSECSGVAPADLAAALSAPIYHVYMLGFLPGQPYLGDLPEAFDLPRRLSPRNAVPAGSVGVAKRLICIYPSETPCGWHIVGRCAARLWQADGPLFQAGDEVRLAPVPAHAFNPDDPALPFMDEAGP
ncbi:MAG: 5-oxoprolinase subunit B family protein [Beijerinckiaceae bacterium]